VLTPTARPTLPQVTLCIVDTRAPRLAWQALQRSLAQLAFGRVLLFTDAAGAAVLPADARIETIPIATLRCGADYSRFIVQTLPAHVHTSHVLVTQWDGFVVDGAAWRDEFLAWDYIGAVWPEQPAATAVGNGGFSLRSRRFLQAAPGLALAPAELHPEDVVLCRTHRAALEAQGLRFAPVAVARTFACENETPSAPTLGFHGAYHLPRWLDEPTLRAWLAELPNDFFRSRDARRLARALLARRMGQAAGELLRRRRAAGRNDFNTRLLATGAALLRAWPATRAARAGADERKDPA
jgi:hypothetical protein